MFTGDNPAYEKWQSNVTCAPRSAPPPCPLHRSTAVELCQPSCLVTSRVSLVVAAQMST